MYYHDELTPDFFAQIGAAPFHYDDSCHGGSKFTHVASSDIYKRIMEEMASPLTRDQERLDSDYCTEEGLRCELRSIREWLKDAEANYRDEVKRVKGNPDWKEREHTLKLLKQDRDKDIRNMAMETEALETLLKVLRQGYTMYAFEAKDYYEDGLDWALSHQYNDCAHLYKEGVGGLVVLNRR